jgi:membrane protein DedA with SNARE-associated domain
VTTPSDAQPLVAEPVDPPPSAHRPRFSVGDIVCGGGLILGIIAGYVFLALTPSLLAHHVLVLEALAGSNASIVTGAALAKIGREPLAAVIIAPLLTIALYDVFLWWAGRRWGNALVGFYARSSPRAARWIDRTERLVRRRGIWVLFVSYYLPLPNFLVYVSCGTSGMPLWTFVIGDIVGTLLWEALLVSLGWAIGHHAVHIVDVIGHYSTWLTVAIIVCLVGASLRRSHRQIAAMRATAVAPPQPPDK